MQILNTLTQFDTRLFLWCVGTRHQKALVKTARVISRTGDGYMQITVPAALFSIGGQAGQHLLLATALAFALELPIYWVLKNSFQRRRPPEAIPEYFSSITASDRFSFPSGHTAAATLLATLVYLNFGMVVAPLMCWAALVGVSRVILGVHFPTDILAGATLGISIAFISNSLV